MQCIKINQIAFILNKSHINYHSDLYIILHFSVNVQDLCFFRIRSSLQSVLIITEVVSYNPAHGDVYSIQHYVIKFVSDFLQVLRFPPPIQMLFIQLPHDHDLMILYEI